MPLRILRHIIRNQHIDAAGEHPPALPTRRPDQGPVILCRRWRISFSRGTPLLRKRDPVSRQWWWSRRRRQHYAGGVLFPFLRSFRGLWLRLRQLALWLLRISRGYPMSNDIERLFLFHLHEARRIAIRLRMYVQRVKCSRLALRRQSRGFFRKL